MGRHGAYRCAPLSGLTHASFQNASLAGRPARWVHAAARLPEHSLAVELKRTMAALPVGPTGAEERHWATGEAVRRFVPGRRRVGGSIRTPRPDGQLGTVQDMQQTVGGLESAGNACFGHPFVVPPAVPPGNRSVVSPPCPFKRRALGWRRRPGLVEQKMRRMRPQHQLDLHPP